jgi:LPS export ABC transporter protein LptC
MGFQSRLPSPQPNFIAAFVTLTKSGGSKKALKKIGQSDTYWPAGTTIGRTPRALLSPTSLRRDMKGHRWIWIVFLGVMAALGWWFLIMEPGRDSPSTGTETVRGTPQATLVGVHLLEMEGDKRMWEADADRIEVFEDTNTIRISKLRRQIQLVLYRDQDTLTCYANAAEIDNQSREVEVRGDLMAQAKDGTTLWTDSVRWLPESKRLLTDRQVTIRRQGLLVQGLGMEADLTLEEVKILSDISSQFEVSGSQFGLKGGRKNH